MKAVRQHGKLILQQFSHQCEGRSHPDKGRVRVITPISKTMGQSKKQMCVRTLILTVLAIAVPLASPAQDLPTGEDTGPVPFRVDSDASWLRVLVYRGGLLRGLGHNHVVSHNNITGTLLLGQDPLRSEFELEFRVQDLLVDDPQLRLLEGPDFPGQISRKDIAGTRANMLGKKLLQARQFPSIKIRSEQIAGSLPDVEVEATVMIGGAEFTVVFPASIEIISDTFVASGELEIRHAEIGLSPFKAVLGTLRVRDTLTLKYEIAGKRSIASE